MQFFGDVSSEDLVAKAVKGDENAMAELVRRFSPMVNAIASELSGEFEKEDLSQEGMFGLLSAIYGYKNNTGVGFSAFARVCIRNRILNSVKVLSRQCKIVADESSEIVADLNSDPEEICMGLENSRELFKKIEDRLSVFEKGVLELHLCGYRYSDISKKLKCNEKSVDNALQRIRSKLK